MGADPLLGEQWHLNNTGQTSGTSGEDIRAFSAWSVTKGQGVRISVIDDAIETVHPDLAPNVVSGSYNYLTGSNLPLPCVAADDHGTPVAGIIAARDDNAIGVAGVAPRANLVGLNALSSNRDGDLADALNRDLQLNFISNNSWGAPDNGFRTRADATFVRALENGINSGRGGKGTIFVFPAGNGGIVRLANGTNTFDNSNFDGYVNQRGIVTVCSTDHRGGQPSFGERGANIWICAPTTADRRAVSTTGLRGGYINDFNGTSAATPIVSGVVGLMLAANPALTWRDVQWILASTARKNNPSDTSWSGSGLGRYSHKFGFGVIDANAAVNLARTWTSVGGSSAQRSCGSFTDNANVAIPDASASGTPGATVSRTINVAGCSVNQIELVEINFTADHPYSADLIIRLVSPNGTVSELADLRACGSGALSAGENPCRQSYDNWRFSSVRHLGEASNGNWRIEVVDGNHQDVGRLVSWSLKIFGR